MPAFATHYIFLEELKPELESRADFDLDFKVAGVGCQGPDVFLFHRLWPPFTIYKTLSSVSSALHRNKSEKLFEAFADYLKATENRYIVKSYIYAFILHYALDRTCHPYVYAIQDEMTAADKNMHKLTAHNTIEHAVDTYLLYHKRGIYPPSDFDSKATFTDDAAALEEIGRLLSFVIKRSCGREIEPSECIRAITDTAEMQDMLRDTDGGTTRLAHSIERPLKPFIKNFKLSASIKPKDLEIANNCANIKHKPWTSPYDNVTRTESFEELMDIARADALDLLDKFEMLCRGEISAYEATGNISFLTGTEVTE